MNDLLKIGIWGCGEFSSHFTELFMAHPYVRSVIACDSIHENADAFAKKFNIEACYSIDELLEKDINAVAVFTPRHTHGPMVIQALKAGKHVYSAVPMASEISHCEEIVRLVKETNLTYMMGETCVYYPCSLYCREQMQNGAFGKFVYGEAQYHHDISHFSAHHRSEISVLGVPPFFYPTHSLGMLLSASGSYVTKVTAFGYEDTEDEPYFKKEINQWGNIYSNAFSLMKLANGGIIRVNECRRVGFKAPSSYISSFFGTQGGYQFSNAQHIFTKLNEGGVSLSDVSDYLNPEEMTKNKNLPDFKQKVANHTWQWDSFSPIQKRSRLPESFNGLENGHMASHQFLVDDFCTAAYKGLLPTVNAWVAARFTVPGIVAFDSVKADGTPCYVPDFGDPPSNIASLTPEREE